MFYFYVFSKLHVFKQRKLKGFVFVYNDLTTMYVLLLRVFQTTRFETEKVLGSCNFSLVYD